MPGRILKVFLIFLGLLAVLNLGVLDFQWYRDAGEKEEALIAEEKPAAVASAASCGTSCQEAIAEKIREELTKNVPTAGQSSVLPSPAAACKIPTSTQSKVVYIPLTTGGTTKATAWTDIVPSEFYFDLSNYPGAKEVRFETYLSAVNGAARVFTRLYDATNKRGVDSSDLSTSNEAFTRLESGAVSIWRGNNKYTVQIKSEIGIEAQLKEARLKILF